MNEKTKRYWLIAIIALSSLPALFLINPPTHWSLAAGTLYFSAITGYLGVMLILWMYIIGAKSIFGLMFRDIAPIMRIHRWLGTYGAIAILLHPVLIILSYGESLLYTVVPQLGSEFERHVTLGRIAFIMFAIVWISSALLRKKMAYRPWKYLHYLAYICLPFALLHIPGTGSQFASHTFVQAYFYAIVIVTLLITLLRIRGLLNGDKYRHWVSRHGKLTPDAYLLELTPTERSVSLRPGQYVYLKLGFVSEDHPFSVVAFDQKTGVVTLAYRQLGRFTRFLPEIQTGASVYISDGMGSFMDDFDANYPTVFIAGGIGITPFVETITQYGHYHDMWLFYANRTHDTSVLLPQLKTSLGERAISVFNQENAVNPGEENGYLDATMLQKYLAHPSNYRYYICGPEPMMDAISKTLRSLNVPAAQIKTEAFNF